MRRLPDNRGAEHPQVDRSWVAAEVVSEHEPIEVFPELRSAAPREGADELRLSFTIARKASGQPQSVAGSGGAGSSSA